METCSSDTQDRCRPAGRLQSEIVDDSTPTLNRAAVVLAVLGPDASSAILKHLTPEEVSCVTRAVVELNTVEPSAAVAALEQFSEMVSARQYVIKGGIDYAADMLREAFGPETGAHLLDQVNTRIASDLASFDVLQQADPQQLAKFLQPEHPQIIALVLSHLSASQAAVLLTSLPRGMRIDVVRRMAHLNHISPALICKIGSSLERKLKTVSSAQRESYGGVQAVSDMINHLDIATSGDILHAIEQNNAELSEAIRKMMFTFEDLAQLDVRDLSQVLQKADRKLLSIALMAASEQLTARVMSVMSAGRAEMLKDDIEAIGAVKIREVEVAQQHVIAIARDLEKKGLMTMRNEEYIS